MSSSKMNPILGTLAIVLLIVRGVPAEVRRFSAHWRGLADAR